MAPAPAARACSRITASSCGDKAPSARAADTARRTSRTTSSGTSGVVEDAGPATGSGGTGAGGPVAAGAWSGACGTGGAMPAPAGPAPPWAYTGPRLATVSYRPQATPATASSVLPFRNDPLPPLR
jgi:hypothetical protein